MRGLSRQYRRDQVAQRKHWQPRCADCGVILDHRHVKPKGQPRRCGVCQNLHEMRLYLEAQQCESDGYSRSA